MRTFIALILFGLAVWRAFIDWTATFAKGEAWRFADTRTLFEEALPEAYGVTHTLIAGYFGPTVWGYVQSGLALPLVSVLCFAGGLLWMFRRPKGEARRNVFKR